MILPPITDNDLNPEGISPVTGFYLDWSLTEKQRLKQIKPAKAFELDLAIGKLHYEPDFRAIGPDDFDFFSQPGKYRKIEHRMISFTQPSDEVTIWLEAMLPAHYLDGHNLWIFSARADLAFLIDRSVFIAHWNRLLPLAREAAFILPRDESWLLLWEHQGFLTVYRRNPQPLV